MSAKFGFFGDWHGNAEVARQNLTRACDTYEDINTFFHVGDFGFGTGQHSQEFLKTVSEVLTSYDKQLMFIDGNHDDSYTLRNNFSNGEEIVNKVYYLPRGTFIDTLDGVELGLLAVGGAASVNRFKYVEGLTMWDKHGGTIQSDDLVACLDNTRRYAMSSEHNKVRILLSHDSTHIPGNAWDGTEYLSDELSAENRHQLELIWNCFHPEFNIFGHYHVHNIEETDYTTFVCLNKETADFDENFMCIEV